MVMVAIAAVASLHSEVAVFSNLAEGAIMELDDSLMKQTSRSKELKDSKDLILRMCRRDLNQFCTNFIVAKDQLEYFKDVTPQDVICFQVCLIPFSFSFFLYPLSGCH